MRLLPAYLWPRFLKRRLPTSLWGRSLLIIVLLPFIGKGVNGARRWIGVGISEFQPSEFLKPLFIITTAWLLSARYDDARLPALHVSFGLLLLVCALLMLQPDLGQTALIAAVWLAQAMLAGMSLMVFAVALFVALGGIVLAYLFVPHVTSRIDRFLTGGGDTYQIDRALDGFKAGGLFGAGPGEGQNKFALPEPHTDYIFSVIGEEFGAVACIGIAMLFFVIVVRVLMQLLDEENPFVFLAAGGLITQFGAQAAINMAVNVGIAPSKGMTLPFVSYGGSSIVASAIAVGMLLALTRTRPQGNIADVLGRSGR